MPLNLQMDENFYVLSVHQVARVDAKLQENLLVI